MTRIAKSIKNARTGLFFYVLVLAAHLISRNYFLFYLGDEFMGLTGTLRSFLGFLNLAELGIGTAIGFALYKPLFEKDHARITEIIALVGFLYKRIGLIVLVLGIILSLFFPLIFQSVNISLPVIYLAFYTFLLNSLLGYFINYHILLLEADQKSYLIVSYFQSTNIIRLVLQTITAFYFKSFFLWISFEFLFSLAYSFIINVKVKGEYTWLKVRAGNKLLLKKYKELTIKIKQTFVHKISSFVLTGTDQILVFMFVNVQTVAFFANYQLIFSQVNSFLGSIFKNNGASIGNLVAENDSENIQKVFWELMALRFFIGGVISTSIYFLMEPFISLWIGEKYLLGHTILSLMAINFLFSQIRIPVENFKNAYGLFEDTWAPVVEMTLNLGISLVLGYFLGIKGILTGTFLSVLFIVLIWKPYYLHKKGFRRSIYPYFIKFSGLLFCLIVCFILISMIHKIVDYEVKTYTDWIIYAVLTTSFSIVFHAFGLWLFSNGFRDLTIRIYRLIKSYLS